MAKSQDILVRLPGLIIIHQKLPGYEVGRHQHDEHEFFLPLQGEITVDSGTETVKAGPGHMLYVPPDLDHSFASSAQGSGERVIWLIDPKTWNRHVTSKFRPCAFPMNSLAKELVFYLLLHREAQGVKHFISALVESLGESLQARQLSKMNLASEHLSGRVSDERVRRAIALIEESPGEHSLAEIARQSGLSSRNFNRLFLKETGLSPKDLVLLKRVEKAKSLLRETSMTVTDISLEVGYGSLSKFIATFKRLEGVLPSDYRAQPKG